MTSLGDKIHLSTYRNYSETQLFLQWKLLSYGELNLVGGNEANIHVHVSLYITYRFGLSWDGFN